MKKVLKTIGIGFLVILALLLIYSVYNNTKQEVPKGYENTVATGGELEAKYLQKGVYETACYEEKTDDEKIGKFIVHYPKDLEQTDKTYPVIVFNNGSNVTGSRYKYLFEKWASWGFIVVGNEDKSTWSGESAEKALTFLLQKSQDSGSLFYGKVDVDHIGVAGHSQGGVGAFNAATAQESASVYKTIVALSPTQEELADALGWHYNLSEVRVPTLMIAGAKGDGETKTVIPLDKLNIMYDKLTISKVMARRIDAEHNDTDSFADGYVTAWFLWQLQGSEEAAGVFAGTNPELMKNDLYIDQRVNLRK